jgi:integrase
VIPRGRCLASSIRPTDVEAWFEVLAPTPQGKREKPLKWPTIDKINSVMSQVFAHAQRHGLISSQMGCNPFRSPKFGGVRCKAESDYEAKVVTPEQMIAILGHFDRPETKLEWTLALVHAATALRPEECFALKWRDIAIQPVIKYSYNEPGAKAGRRTESPKGNEARRHASSAGRVFE